MGGSLNGSKKSSGSPARDLARQLAAHLDERGASLVIDADVHITDTAALAQGVRERFSAEPNYYHGRPISAEDAIREMDMAGVDMALTWQNPATTKYGSDSGRNTDILLATNRYILDSALRHRRRIVPAGWTDPRACGVDGALYIVETCVREFAFPVVKMNAAQNRYPIDSPEVLCVLDRIVELQAIPAFHFGADTPYTPIEGLETIARRYPEHPVMAIHMGGGGAGYTQADALCIRCRELGLRYPNLRFVLSAVRDTHIESNLITYQIAGEPWSRNLLCASDAPYGRMTWNYGGFRAMFSSLIDGGRHTDERVRSRPGLFTPESVRNYMGANFARMAMAAYDRILKVENVPASV